MIPIYSITNFLAVHYYYHAIYYSLLGNAYAAIGLASFYQLLVSYIGDNLHQQKEYFRKTELKPWGWPISWLPKRWRGESGLLRTPRNGLMFFDVIGVGSSIA